MLTPEIPNRRARHQSIRWRLPLLICGLMLAAVVAFGWAAYGAVRQVLMDAARTRLSTVSTQVGQLLDQAVVVRLEDARRLASVPAVAAAFDDPGAEALQRAAEAVDAYLAANPPAQGVALWSATGEQRFERTVASPALAPITAPAAEGVSPIDEIGGVAYYDIAVGAPADDPLGFLVIRRRTATAGTGATIRGLLGGNTSLAIGTPFTGVWTDLSTSVPGPPLPAQGVAGEFVNPTTGGAEFGTTRAIAGAPWLLWVHTPSSVVLAPARRFLLGMIPLTLLIVGTGALIAWFMARRITRPLTDLTGAARAVSGGDLSKRTDASRRDELGELGEAFNMMVARVEDSHQELDTRVRERTRDLSEALSTLKNTQEELVRREKLATLGQLAGSVGHELRNPLGVMTNAVYVLEMAQADAPPLVHEYHALLRAQIGLAEKIISDLLDFGRIKPPQCAPVAVATIVDDQLARVDVPCGVKVVREWPADLPMVVVDRFQIGQVLLNLLMNALQAMEDTGGVLTIGADVDGGTVRLRVRDTGPGVPEEVRERIFDALFTTKARGIGLGLAVSASLAEANGGALTLAPAGGGGAMFVLTLPADRPTT